ncbi:ATP-binding protein [Vibrio europaeus]|uniref:histidine kinase n=1 Tax=Vibrio europaeus TaxID=300876 RepID=A0A178JFG3_9VIBR|nr:ATP-binding protein [Vibrio europaeus]MDC5707202.1 ATP-binding protein [Vibrio europaeus]MDC5712567.1 ATP-binding protein [Vibrio europaeus]MDC5717210.1 ATP-binding protein [Vibrio europaeus]MDC5721256.1 ATP-binding protein [Vibrio europaeus]MDC5726510.1 ATP-binding protein [Vibrio europaeus]
MDKDTPLERKLAREIAARKQAEALLEQKSLELYESNQHLKLVLTQLKRQTHSDLHKLEFEQHISEALIHFGRAFLSRTLDDGLIANLLERLTASSALSGVGLYTEPELMNSVIGNVFGSAQYKDLSLVKPYAIWHSNSLKLPIEVEHRIVGELTVDLTGEDIDREFVVNQLLLVAELLCSAISRQLIVTSNQEARARAEESERSTKEFVAMINHELRTPLNGLLGSAELLAGTPLDEEQQTLLSNLSHSGDLLRHIINDILDFSKMSAGMMQLIPSQFLWSEMREMVLGIFETKALEKGIGFEIIEENTIPTALIGDFERISQILINLVGNAIKFTSHGEVIVKAKWENENLLFAVSDTGIGISEESQTQLFTPFVQADRTAKRNFEGTGLGLAICKNLVELMSGEISLSSEIGKGSTFEVLLPLKETAEWTVSAGKAEQHPQFKPLEELSILVVDDIRMNQVIINQMLKKLSITPDMANNGLEAIKAFNSSKYDLVFMDCRMPEMDGFEATAYLREQAYTLPIIALTAGTTLEEREKCIQCGMDDILTKPYTAKDLKLMLEKWS